MKRLFVRFFAVLMIMAVLLPSVFSSFALPAKETKDVTVLFTHDLHSHFLPTKYEDGISYGGFSRLKTIIDDEKIKHPGAILVDGGDFSMGSLFQSCYATDAMELKLMAQMGYDATTFGNHEFDYLPEGLIGMLNSAASADEGVVPIVEANYSPESDELKKAFDNYGVKEYILIERDGVHFAIFGLNGFDSDDCAPNSGMILADPVASAQKTVDAAVSECTEKYGTEPVVVCLSHGGTEDGMGEDYELATNVEGIDVIVSGHSHTTLSEPVEVNDTYIVSAGEYGKHLGVISFAFDGERLYYDDYYLRPVTASVEEDPEISKKIEAYKKTVEDKYLSKYNMTFDKVLVENIYDFETVKDVYATQHESTLGNVFSDAYKWSVENVTGETVDVALTAAGVIRESIPVGNITVSDVFNAASLGVGTEGELVKVYITGKDLKNALEVDASVQPIMKSAQLFFSGVKYSFNTNRMIFNKVDSAKLLRADGTLEKIENDKLYSIVTGMYAGQMLGSVKEKSFGLLSITPLDKDGNPIEADELVNFVVKDKNGNPVKEWYAIASYLESMGGIMSEKYAQPDGRKVVFASLNPIDMIRNANIFTYGVAAAVVVIIGVITLVTVLIVKKIRRKRKNKENNEEK